MSHPSSLPAAPKAQAGGRMFLVALVVVALMAAGVYYLYVVNTSRPEPVDEIAALRGILLRMSTGQKLAEGYIDADGDLIPDAPTDPGKLLKVDEIAFSLVAGDNSEAMQAEWKDFLLALEKTTGKKVKHRTDIAAEDAQLDALRKGTLHVTAISTGAVPPAVNTAGFVPLVTPADAEGRYSYEMEILVPASSSVQTPADLKGKRIAFTTLSSNSGAKAPMVILKEKFRLLPIRDYQYVSTGTHRHSIKELTEGKHDAICVANDLLARAVTAGDIKTEQYRSIFKSESFPPLCFGMAYNLPPELASQVKKTFEEFRFEGTSLAKRNLPQGKVRFARVDYKRDWAYVRQIDDALTRLLDAK